MTLQEIFTVPLHDDALCEAERDAIIAWARDAYAVLHRIQYERSIDRQRDAVWEIIRRTGEKI